jgi:betaine-homocysteine S-methyltransferase
MKIGLLERLQNGGVVLGDGGYLMGLRLRGFARENHMTPLVVVEHPDAVQQLTREFRDAGSEVLQTLTFFGTRNMMEYEGLGDRAEEINRTAVQIAKEVAGDDVLVAGNLCSPTIVTKDFIPGDERAQKYVAGLLEEQLAWIVDEGVDLLILETFSWLEEALLALELAKQTKLPTIVTMAYEGHSLSKIFEGIAPGECSERLSDAGADVVGVNCLVGPKNMLSLAEQMQQQTDRPIAIQPSAFHTWWEAVEEPIAPSRFARFARDAQERKMGYLGACCGAGPEHIRAMAEALGKPTR